MNFDEYDKSDDPHDYKFVRWLTKEKVGKKSLKLLCHGPWFLLLQTYSFCSWSIQLHGETYIEKLFQVIMQLTTKFNCPRLKYFSVIFCWFFNEHSLLREFVLFPHLHSIPLNINILEPSTSGFALSRSVNRLSQLYCRNA